MGNVCFKKGSPKDRQKYSTVTHVETIKRISDVDDVRNDPMDHTETAEPAEEEDEDDEQERDEINILRMWLFNDLPMFVLNNTLMSIQFFRNFEEEIDQLRRELRQSDAVDVPGHRFQYYQADRLMELVGTHVVYRPKHGALNNTETLLHPLRSFLLYQNVHVQWDKDVRHPAKTMERPFYVMKTEDASDEHLAEAGYLSLKVIESKQIEVIYESIDNNTSPPHSPPATRRPSTIFPNTLLTVPIPEETTYGYTTIRRLTIAQEAGKIRRGYTPLSSCVIPPDTITQIERPVLETRRRTGAATTVKINYLNSVKFTQQFLDALVDCLSEPLNLGMDLDNAPVQGGRVIVNQGKATYYIMPALSGKFWPDPGRRFAMPGNDDEYDWPKNHMKKRVENMGVAILPLGYLKRRGHNEEFELQWRYVCPQAEQYMLLHTMHAHVRCYLFTLTIFKTYLEDTFLGLDHTHILHLLFAEIEKNFLGWPEDRPADTLLNFLNVISHSIEKRVIRDFFIHDRNMLESSPYLFLNKVQGKLAAVLENPLPYILLALKNLRTRSQFYPQLDLTRVYHLATTKNVITYLYPHLRPRTKPTSKIEFIEDDEYEEDEQVVDANHAWRQQRAQELKAQQKLNDTHRASTETINLQETPIQTSAEDDSASERRQAILQEFIQHFIEMGKTSIEYNALAQAHIYLQQAQRLNILYREENSDSQQVKNYSAAIKQELKKFERNGEPNNRSSFSQKENTQGGIRLSLHSRPLPEPPA